jgi:formamidopyrimidine-DNA glycosylase
VWIAADDDAVAEIVGDQGPDALTVDAQTFADRLSRRRGALKPALMDQAVIAGLGNLLSDEICWQARITPTRRLTDLEPDEVRRLHTTMRRVLRTSVRHERVPGLPRWLTGVRDDPDPHCPRCGTALRRGHSSGRTTLWCPNCQRR